MQARDTRKKKERKATAGSSIALRALIPSDAKVTWRWRIDAEIASLVVGPKRFVSEETERAWMDRAIAEHMNGTHLRLAITLPDGSKPVGIIHVLDIDRTNRTCKTGILIGDRAQWGRGVAKAAYAIVLPHIFDEMGMNAVRAEVLATNKASLALYRSLGFKEEGRLRQAIFKNGRTTDLVVLSLLRREHART